MFQWIRHLMEVLFETATLDEIIDGSRYFKAGSVYIFKVGKPVTLKEMEWLSDSMFQIRPDLNILFEGDGNSLKFIVLTRVPRV